MIGLRGVALERFCNRSPNVRAGLSLGGREPRLM
jgi:hypothetical protein